MARHEQFSVNKLTVNEINGLPVPGPGVFDGFFGTNVWFVDGATGSDGFAGTSDAPFDTIQKAIDVAGKNDTIYIRSNNPTALVNQGQPVVYAENLLIPVTKTGLKLIGTTYMKDPYFGPKIKPASSAAHVITCHAAGVVFENLCIMNNPANTAGIFLSFQGIAYNAAASSTGNLEYVGSCGAQIRNCEFREGSATGPSIVIRGGYQSTIYGCTFVTIATTGQAIQIGDDILPSRGHKIINCDFMDANGAIVPNYITIGTGQHVSFLIKDCTFGQATKHIVVGAGNQSGIIANCFFADAGATATAANSGGKIEIPAANDTVAVIGCYGGNAAIVASNGS